MKAEERGCGLIQNEGIPCRISKKSSFRRRAGFYYGVAVIRGHGWPIVQWDGHSYPNVYIGDDLAVNVDSKWVFLSSLIGG